MKVDTSDALLVLALLWLYRKLENPIATAIEAEENFGKDIYERTHSGEKDHMQDLPEHSLGRGALLDLVTRVGFPDPQMAVAIILAESGGRPHEIVNNAREHSVGLFQINVRAHPNYSEAFMLDPGMNAEAAFAISKRGTDWRPWSTYWANASKRQGPGKGRFLLFLRRA